MHQKKINLDHFFTCHGCKPGRHFRLSCSEVNSTGYSDSAAKTSEYKNENESENRIFGQRENENKKSHAKIKKKQTQTLYKNQTLYKKEEGLTSRSLVFAFVFSGYSDSARDFFFRVLRFRYFQMNSLANLTVFTLKKGYARNVCDVSYFDTFAYFYAISNFYFLISYMLPSIPVNSNSNLI